MRKTQIKIISALISLLMLFSCLGGLNVSAEETDYTAGTPKIGIDVSYYQGDINWQKVKTQIDFAIIRVGYTGYGNLSINLDTRFDEYVKGATSAGIPIGVYYYGCATSVEMAIREAEFVLKQIERYPATFTYPIIYDVETSPDLNSKAYKLATESSKAFCDTIRAAGYYPMVYSYTSYFNPYITTATISDNDFWQAHYYTSYSGLTPSQLADKAPNRPSILGNYDSNISIWQCTDGAKVSGISAGVDCNICYFDYDSFIQSEGYNGFTQSSDNRLAICAGDSVNIRKGASTAFEVIGTALYGEEFEVKKFYNKDWIEIEYNDETAFVYADYFNILDVEDANEEDTNYVVKEYVICTGSVVNIRAEANTKCEILGQAVNGDEFLFIEDLDEWLKIEYNGEEAYIYAAYTTRRLVKEPAEGVEGGAADGEIDEGTKNEPDTAPDDESANADAGRVERPRLSFWQEIGKAVSEFFSAFISFFTRLFS